MPMLISSGVGLYLIVMFRSPQLRHSDRKSVRKRSIFAAWAIDFALVLFALVPSAAVISLAIESAFLGELVFSFERDFVRATDLIGVLMIIFVFVVLGLYFGRATSGGQVTIGQYLMHFRVKIDPSLPSWRRVFGVAILPWSMLARPVEAKIGIRRSPTFAFTEIEVERIE